MAHVVFVHGIAQEHAAAAPLEESWAQYLAGGVTHAKRLEIAERLWHQRHTAVGLRCRMAFYGSSFLTAGLQGAAALPAVTDPEMAEALARAWLTNVRDRASSPRERQRASDALATADADPADAQGGGRVAGNCINELAKIRWFSHLGMTAAKVFSRSLAQVDTYLNDENVRRTARDAVHALVDDTTRVIIGHSLGAVVAYEVAHELDAELDLLVTLGSPLGIRNVVYDRLEHRCFPRQVRRWVNIADTDDFIAAQPDLSGMFEHIPQGSVFEPFVTVDNGAKPHTVEFYLTKAAVGGPVADALS